MPACSKPWLHSLTVAIRRLRRPLGPFWDHTLYALQHDLRVYARHARPETGRIRPATCGNALPPFPGGQVVAGSIPVSLTQLRGGFRSPESRLFRTLAARFDPNWLPNSIETRLLD